MHIRLFEIILNIISNLLYMVYEITNYTKNRARVLGVTVKPSTNPKKKIDVYKNGVKVASIGDDKYLDFPTYVKLNGIEYANKRRQLYKIRHAKDISIEYSNGWYADKLLW